MLLNVKADAYACRQYNAVTFTDDSAVMSENAALSPTPSPASSPAEPAYLPAAFWRRLGAMLYDGIVILALWMVVGFLVLSAFGIEQARTLEGEQVVLDPLYRLTLFSAMLLSAYLFFAGFWTRSGQTIGMLAWKIRIQNRDGSVIGWKQSLLRFALGGLGLLAFGLGHLWMLTNRQRRALHDIASDSVVVRQP